jgi:hypothetical protein
MPPHCTAACQVITFTLFNFSFITHFNFIFLFFCTFYPLRVGLVQRVFAIRSLGSKLHKCAKRCMDFSSICCVLAWGWDSVAHFSPCRYVLTIIGTLQPCNAQRSRVILHCMAWYVACRLTPAMSVLTNSLTCILCNGTHPLTLRRWDIQQHIKCLRTLRCSA